MSVELGLLISILGVVIAFQGYQLNKQKSQSEQTEKAEGEAKAEAKESAQIMTQLGYIGKGVDDIRLEMKDIRLEMKTNDQKVQGQFQAMAERVTRAEESVKSAHNRIDEILEGKK